MNNPQIHIYHGTGKGKTTASIGLAIRAAGADKRVIFAQFMKGNDSSEMKILRSIPNITVLQVGKQFGFSWQMSEEDKREITGRHTGMLQQIRELVDREAVDLIVLDEINSAYQLDFVPHDQVLELLQMRPAELVLTGRNPAPELIEMADYLTEMRAERHPYEKGLTAREGIEW